MAGTYHGRMPLRMQSKPQCGLPPGYAASETMSSRKRCAHPWPATPNARNKRKGRSPNNHCTLGGAQAVCKESTRQDARDNVMANATSRGVLTCHTCHTALIYQPRTAKPSGKRSLTIAQQAHAHVHTTRVCTSRCVKTWNHILSLRSTMSFPSTKALLPQEASSAKKATTTTYHGWTQSSTGQATDLPSHTLTNHLWKSTSPIGLASPKSNCRSSPQNTTL